MTTSYFLIFYLMLLCLSKRVHSSPSTSNQALRYIRMMAMNRRNRNTRSRHRSPYSSPPYALSPPAPPPQKTMNTTRKSELLLSRCMNRSKTQDLSIKSVKTLYREMLYKHTHAITQGHYHFIEMCYQEDRNRTTPPLSPLSPVTNEYNQSSSYETVVVVHSSPCCNTVPPRPVYKNKRSRTAHNRSVRFIMTPDTKEFIEGWGDNSSINTLYPGEPPVSQFT